MLSIAALLFALVPPMMSTVMPGVQTRAAAYDLAATLRDSRDRAVGKARTVQVHFDLENHRITTESEQRSLQNRVTYELLELHAPERTGHLDRTTYSLSFYPDGSSNGMRMRIGDEANGYVVSVGWLMGRIALTKAGPHAR